MNSKNKEYSEILDNMNKIAESKGLVYSDSLNKIKNKKDAKKLDLSLSKNFEENVIKLANGLRQEGFVAYADHLESKLLLLKQAKTHMYKVFEEEGKDLLEFSHPEGSHTVLKAKDDNGDVEDLLDQQEKDIAVVKKQPTGKLSSAALYITAAASDNDIVKEKILLAKKEYDNMREIVNKKLSINLGYPGETGAISGDDVSTRLNVSEMLRGLTPFGKNTFTKALEEPSIEHIVELRLSIKNRVQPRLKPGVISGLDEDTWVSIKGYFDRIDSYLKKAQDIMSNSARDKSIMIDFLSNKLSLFQGKKESEKIVKNKNLVSLIDNLNYGISELIKSIASENYIDKNDISAITSESSFDKFRSIKTYADLQETLDDFDNKLNEYTK